MKYKILEHAGDAKIMAFGKTKEELFLNAMLGMSAILKPKPKADLSLEEKVRNIEIQSVDINALLVDFLSEINYLRAVHMEIYDRINFSKFSDTYIDAEVAGCEVEEFGEDIKAVTFHNLKAQKNTKGMWEAVIVFDI